MEVFSSANVMFMLGGFVKTLEISALSIFFSLILGTVLALVKAYAAKPFSLLVSAYIELFRCTPNLLWILFIYFTVKGSDVFISTLAFTIFTSAVMAEIVRGGLNSIPQSQFEAAQSQGFGFFATMRLIILPQTFKTIIPALFSQCTTVIKDSSYLAGINVAEFMYTSKVVMAKTQSLNEVLLVYGFVFLLYFALNFGISLFVRAYQRRQVAA
ncbi:MAG: amino acid ABC transporter permease [Parolsenella sp.]|uniref:amino acid ABC transporter permease n=1 Tax=Parolsenella sp. TaxID=2083006 RepID=UPI002A75D01C|nr:amino acid ABC transporter permease [Parolsenella sp.]MCI5950504.1 amino acid ABC transporter permease [Coriobacteriaceae bacterium]MDY3292687.1 amino acid ABC transporter permease [Parolsenella sp.]